LLLGWSPPRHNFWRLKWKSEKRHTVPKLL
jgi:hypothetical protein